LQPVTCNGQTFNLQPSTFNIEPPGNILPPTKPTLMTLKTNKNDIPSVSAFMRSRKNVFLRNYLNPSICTITYN